MDRPHPAASWIRLTGLAAALLIGVTACGGNSDKPDASGSSAANARPTVHPTVGSQCPSDRADSNAKQVWFTDKKGANLGGLELGTGTTGIVMSHQAVRDACDWLPYGAELAKAGYRVLTYDFGGSGVSDELPGDENLDADVVAAAAFLRSEGATTIVLMGGSMGAAASIVAATELTPPPAALVSLSSPTSYNGIDAGGAAAKLTVPVLFAAGEQDYSFAPAAQQLYTAAPSTAKSILITSGGQHATALLVNGPNGAPDADKLRKAIEDLLKAHAPVSG
jgi:pimeloyl-ACP methyl ester carboxylesterase